MASMNDCSSITGSYWDLGGESSLDLALDSSEPVVSIFGRTHETQLLGETFQQVLDTKCAARVVVHGESGVGKTSLIDTLRVPVMQSQGYFCAGKFFQNSSVQEPYSAIMAAFSDLCDLVVQSEDFTKSRQTDIQQALGADGHLLAKAISNISSLLGDTLPSDSTGGEDGGSVAILAESSLAKFKVACKTFLQAVSSQDHPVVLFIDDIQWMDAGSMQLLELFVSDVELKNVLLILAYRDEEAEVATSIFSDKHSLVDIPLKKLDSVAIHEMVCTATGSSSESLRELSVLTEQRSRGNPFHAQLFLATIEREGMLTFDPTSEEWDFDVEEIRSLTMVLANVADLLSRKIELVSVGIKETLKVASLIGYRFSEGVLLEAARVVQSAWYDGNDTVSKALMEAVKIGFIEEIKGGYQFTHDKIQTAFQEMIGGDEEVKHIHKVVGETILSLGDDNDATMYHAVVHLNVASVNVALTDQELHRLLQMNLRASKHCINQSAFDAASEILQFGINSMGTNRRWSKPFFDVSSELTELLAKTELVIGNFDGCKEATREALKHSKTTEMRVKALYLDLEARIANNELDQLVPSANRVLEELGVKMPKRVTYRHVVFNLLKVKMMLRGRSDEQILALPTMDDQKTSTAIQVLTYLSTHSLLCDNEDQAVYSALKAMELTLKGGLSPSSSMAFVIYGIVEESIGNHDASYRFGKLALKLLQSRYCKSSVCPTVGFILTLLTYRKEAFSDMRQELAEAGNIGFEIGDIVYGTFCATHSCLFGVIMGSNLHELEQSLRYTVDQIGDLRQGAMLLWCKPALQYVLNLQRHPGNWDEVLVLTGEAMHEEDFMLAVRKANHPVMAVIAMILKSMLTIFFRRFDDASDYCDMMETFGKAAKMSHGQVPSLFCAAFANYELYRTSKKRKNLRKARKHKLMLEDLLSSGCQDARGWYTFLVAVELSLKKSVGIHELLDTYNKTTALLEKEGPAHVEGLMNEQAGFDLASRGYQSEAHPFFERALEVYKSKWCSNAKYQWLLEHSAHQYSKDADTVEAVGTPQIGNVVVYATDNE